MSLLKLLVASLALVAGVALALPGAEVSAQDPEPAPTCEDPNAEHVLSLTHLSPQVGFAFPVPGGPTFWASNESWFLRQGDLDLVPSYYPLDDGDPLEPGFYVLRAHWLDPIPARQVQVDLGDESPYNARFLTSRTVGYLGRPVVRWAAFEIRDLEMSVLTMRHAGASSWTVDLWQVDCVPWDLNSRYIW